MFNDDCYDLNKRRLKLSKREDGYIISTVKSFDNWYGEYETAICYRTDNWRIAEGYKTEEEAIKGHEKYLKMTAKEIERLEFIG